MDDHDLFSQFAKVQWLLHRYHLESQMMHGPMGDPHRGQGRILALLQMKPEISQKELSFLLDITPQSLGELLSKLEKAEYIRRYPSEEDRRVMIVELTEKGKEATDNKTNEDELFKCFNEEEKDTLKGYLDRFAEHMESILHDDGRETMSRDEMMQHRFDRMMWQGMRGGPGPHNADDRNFGGPGPR